MLALKLGLKEPLLRSKEESVASEDCALVIVTVYVPVVPFWAVTTTVTVFEPTLMVIAWEALPEIVFVPLTLTVALGSLTVGVRVMLVTVLAIEAV